VCLPWHRRFWLAPRRQQSQTRRKSRRAQEQRVQEPRVQEPRAQELRVLHQVPQVHPRSPPVVANRVQAAAIRVAARTTRAAIAAGATMAEAEIGGMTVVAIIRAVTDPTMLVGVAVRAGDPATIAVPARFGAALMVMAAKTGGIAPLWITRRQTGTAP
jgi:hypothetical protein